MLSGNFFKGEPTRKLDEMVFDAHRQHCDLARFDALVAEASGLGKDEDTGCLFFAGGKEE